MPNVPKICLLIYLRTNFDFFYILAYGSGAESVESLVYLMGDTQANSTDLNKLLVL